VDRAILVYDEAPEQGAASKGEAGSIVILAFPLLANRDNGASLQFRAKGFDGEPEFGRDERRVHNEVFTIAVNARTDGLRHGVLPFGGSRPATKWDDDAQKNPAIADRATLLRRC
jgi:hypothetical protein